jgi:hypothetical protein
MQTKKRKKTKKRKQPVPRADKNLGGLSNIPPFRRIRRIEKHIPIDTVERMSLLHW